MAKKTAIAVIAGLVTSTVSALVADGFAALEELGGELRDWHDNLPDSLKDHRSDVDEAAGTLESLSELDDAPDAVKDIEVSYQPLKKRKPSRADRGGQATYEMGVAIEALEEWLNDEANAAQRDEVESWRDEVQNVIDEAEGVEYPGMYA